MKQLKDLKNEPAEGIKVIIDEGNVADVFAEVLGPVDTPFYGGTFMVKLALPLDFPRSAPKGFFLTKIFHPNIRQPSGEICVNTLKKDWSPSLGLRHVLMVIRCLLIEPFPESALNEEAAKLLLEDYEEYFRRARMFTTIHANLLSTQKSCEHVVSSSEFAGIPLKVKGSQLEKPFNKKKSLRRL